jgi:hypothetical protein
VHRLTALEILAIWDAGTGRSAASQALASVAPCLPGWSAGELAALPLGFRDALLLELHAATFGPQLNSIAVCPHCGERVEFSVSLADLPPGPGVDDLRNLPVSRTLEAQGMSVEYRLPDSVDLDIIATVPDPSAAAAMLAQRCVLSVRQAGGAEAVAEGNRDLPGALADELEAEMARQQPWADIQLELSCPSCGTAWQPGIDVGAFIWAEIESEGRRLLQEVDALARAYGWSERDILDMASVRRYRYLEMTS